MATTTGTVVFYNAWIATMLNAANLDTDTFKMGLLSSSYDGSASLDSVLADITVGHTVTTNIANTTYVTSGVHTIQNSVYTQTAGVGKFDYDDPVFTASGGSVTAKYFYIYDDTLASDDLVCYGLLDQSGQSVTTTSGNTLTLNIDSNGLFTVTIV